MSEERTFGINSRILDVTIGKRFVELMSGKGGLGSLLLWLSQLDFVEGLQELVNSISRKEMFYDTALMKCAKEALKRPFVLREEEIATMLGDVCVECGRFYSMLGDSPSRCKCDGVIESRYSLVLDKFGELDINPIPEAVMMWVAYDELADAYFQAYQATRKALTVIVEQRGWSSPIQFLDYELKDRLDFSFYYGEPGDQRLAKEEREILMFLFRGNVAGVGLGEAEKLIRVGVAVMKFGHLFNQLFCSGADLHYNSSIVEFSILYAKANEKYRKETTVGRKEREKRTIEVLPLADKRYYALSLLSKDYWASGKLSKRIVLKPIEDLPIITTDKVPAINAIVGPSGTGKTSFMGALICESFEKKHEIMLNVLSDEANSLLLAGLPVFQCEGSTGLFIEKLESIGVRPKGMPCVNLTFLRDDEEIPKDQIPANPPTKFDYIVRIPDAYSFGFDFENKQPLDKNPGVVNILEDIALKMGYKRACGLINVRNLSRLEVAPDNSERKPDIEIATWLLNKFDTYRQSNKTPSARVLVDEASYLAPVQHSVAGSDTSKSSSTLSSMVKRVRKLNCSFDLATQKYSEVNPDVRTEATTVSFRELPKAGDKSRSQQDIVLDSLLLREGKSLRDMIAGCMDRGTFPHNDFFWFMYNKFARDVEVVKPNPPFFMLNQPKKTNREIFQEYEKATDTDILYSKWSDLPPNHELSYQSTEYAGRRQIKIS